MQEKHLIDLSNIERPFPEILLKFDEAIAMYPPNRNARSIRDKLVKIISERDAPRSVVMNPERRESYR